jgi:C1A family cysteine protease
LKPKKVEEEKTCFHLVNSWGEEWGSVDKAWVCLDKPDLMEFNGQVQYRSSHEFID